MLTLGPETRRKICLLWKFFWKEDQTHRDAFEQFRHQLNEQRPPYPPEFSKFSLLVTRAFEPHFSPNKLSSFLLMAQFLIALSIGDKETAERISGCKKVNIDISLLMESAREKVFHHEMKYFMECVAKDIPLSPLLQRKLRVIVAATVLLLLAFSAVGFSLVNLNGVSIVGNVAMAVLLPVVSFTVIRYVKGDIIQPAIRHYRNHRLLKELEAMACELETPAINIPVLLVHFPDGRCALAREEQPREAELPHDEHRIEMDRSSSAQEEELSLLEQQDVLLPAVELPRRDFERSPSQ